MCYKDWTRYDWVIKKCSFIYLVTCSCYLLIFPFLVKDKTIICAKYITSKSECHSKPLKILLIVTLQKQYYKTLFNKQIFWDRWCYCFIMIAIFVVEKWFFVNTSHAVNIWTKLLIEHCKYLFTYIFKMHFILCKIISEKYV